MNPFLHPTFHLSIHKSNPTHHISLYVVTFPTINIHIFIIFVFLRNFQGSNLRVPQAAGQLKILIFLVKIKLFPIYVIIFCDAGQVPNFINCIGVAFITQLLMCILKIVRIQRKSHNVEIVFSVYHEGLFLKEKISSQREQILSSKRSPNFEKGHN